MEKALYYFGCNTSPGHYLHRQGMVSVNEYNILLPEVNRNLFHYLDGPFCPPAGTPENTYQVSTVGDHIMILSWWDNSIDHRPGSHCTFIAYGYSSELDVLSDAYKIFPSVMKRQRNQITKYHKS